MARPNIQIRNIAPDPRLPHVQDFCRRIEPESTPSRILFAPHDSRLINECFLVVDRVVRKRGGTSVVGWAIHEMPGLYIEAEFHAVWRNRNGQLIDVTPRPVGYHQTTFLPAPHRQYEGRQVNNIRHALKDDPRITRFLALHDELFAIENEGELAHQHGQIVLTEAASMRRQRILIELADIAQAIGV